VLATIPVGLSGLALEHLFRTTLGKPIPAAVFLIVNDGILLGRERLRRRSAAPVNAVAADTDTPATPDGSGSMGIAADERLAQMSLAQGVLIGCAQILALLPGGSGVIFATLGAVGALDARASHCQRPAA
jgi:undecaprenyl-diphosphatase